MSAGNEIVKGELSLNSGAGSIPFCTGIAFHSRYYFFGEGRSRGAAALLLFAKPCSLGLTIDMLLITDFTFHPAEVFCRG